ncbi:MAG: DNA polymerase III subunit alpha, partial [Chloroflexota bacterium]|nr:DNA polymerase III subunit alpha [Chloroflexota bacterium]
MNDIPFLRTHSYFGFLESLISPEDLVTMASNQGVRTLGLTDHRYLGGSIAFYEACMARGIKPIIGLEIDFNYKGYQGLLTLIAKNREGWANLSRLSSLMLVENMQIGLKHLQNHRSGLMCITGDPRGILRALMFSSSQSLHLPDSFLTDIKCLFEDDLYFEIQRFMDGKLKNEKSLLNLAKDYAIPTIATQNIFYKNPQDQAIYRTLSAIRQNTNLEALKDDHDLSRQAHFPTKEDFIHRFQDIPESIENLQRINSQCRLTLPVGQTHYPEFKTPPGLSQAEYLKKKAYEGARKIYHHLDDTITKRLNYELNVISEMGYEPIFLIVQDVINQARRLGIPTSSRGSAASSLVAHCLNITSPDPIALNLYFERFLNPARKKPPDIDIDIASQRRDEVIQYVFDTYGDDHVAMVGTINRYRPKSALKDVAKVYGLSQETIRQLSKRLPSSFSFRRNDEEGDPFSGISGEHSIPMIQSIIKDAKAMLDIPRHLSVHPGGIIIAPFPIRDLVPLVHSTSLGVNHTQFDLDGIEKLGLVKIDLLGIRGLTVLGEVANKVRSWRISEFKNGLEVLDSIPKNDPETEKTVSEAQTIGCFQIESPGMRATLREINASNIEDIMAALALYRPGPLRGGLRDAFVRRFRGEEPIEHLHPSLMDLLGDTFGVILYQEQVLRIAHELGGLSIAQADILRRAMSHFDPGGVMDTLRKQFIEGALLNKGVPIETGERIWEMMAAFAGYGFPKAHAASYAKLAWNAAWCKTHFPAEFMAAVLGFGGGYYSQRVYLMEARRLGLSIAPPHINHSNHRFRVAYPNGEPKLYMGLGQVRELTQKTIGSIIRNRPFHSLEDFLIRVDPHHKEAENLIRCGALANLATIPEALERLTHKHPVGQLSLFSDTKQREDYGVEKKYQAQMKILGVSLDFSPLEKYGKEILSSGAISTLKAEDFVGEKVRVAGMRQTYRRIRTKSKQMMAVLTLEDMEGSLQIFIPPYLYRKNHLALQEFGPFIIEGVIQR